MLSLAVASVSGAQHSDDPVVRFSFNQPGGALVADDTRMAFDAELFGDAEWADGRFGAAIRLPASGGYLQVSAQSSERLDFDALSVAAWIHPTAVAGADHYIASRHRGCCKSSGGYGLAIDSAGSLRAEVWLASASAPLVATGSSAIPQDQWTHVAFTFDGTTLRVFVDGAEDGAAQLAVSDRIRTSSEPLTIGALARANGDAREFQGRIDEFRLYDRALAGVEVADLHAAPGGEPGLLFYESFDSVDGILENGGALGDHVIEPGRFGGAVRIPAAGGPPLEFPTAGNIDFQKGTISFWFKPAWDGDVPYEHYLFEMYDDADHPPLQLRKWYGGTPALNQLVFRFDGVVDGVLCAAKPCSRQVGSGALEPDATMRWKAGEWHHVAVSWDFTLPDAGHYVAFIVDGVRGDATESQRDPGDFDALRFAVGSRFNGAFPADGWIDELRIHAEPAFDSRNPTETYVRATRGDGVWQPHETVHDSPLDAPRLDGDYAPSEDVFFYATAPFAAVYEGSVPEPAQIVAPAEAARYRSAIGETQTLFFNVYSRIELRDAAVTIGNLTGSGGAIDAADIDLRVVKNWWQAGAGHQRSYYPPVYTPELLLSDDRIDFSSHAWSRDDLPSLPDLGYALTDIDAYTSKQFAVELTIPADAAPGVYSGAVVLAAPGVANRSMNIELAVLDIPLAEPDKDFIVYHRANYHDVSDADYVSEAIYDQQVSDIRRHGFNRIYLRATDATYIDKVAAEGFSRLAVSQVGDLEKLDAMLAHGLEPFFYGVDEPNSLAEIRAQIERSAAIHSLCSGSACGKVITAIAKAWADRLRDPGDPIYQPGEYEPLDYANLNLGASEAYIGARLRGERDGAARKEYRQVYYWQIRREDPRVNRYYAGFHLWLTDLDGIYPYVYQSVREDPYDDFDIEPGVAYRAAERDAHASYPSQQGPVCTVEWEALREGIDDYRYLRTWALLREQLESIDPDEAARSAAAVDAALEKYRAADALEAVDIAAYDADRQRIEGEILALSARLETDGAAPEPRALLLLGAGALLVTGLARRRRVRAARSRDPRARGGRFDGLASGRRRGDSAVRSNGAEGRG